MSEIAPETQPEVVGDSVSQINVVVTQTPTTAVSTPVTVSEPRQTKMLSETLEREKLSPVEMELTVPYVDHTQKDMPFINFMIPSIPQLELVQYTQDVLHYCQKGIIKCAW